MNVKVQEVKEMTVKDQTVDGILFNIYMLAAAVNVPIVFLDFLPQAVTVKVILYRDRTETVIVQNNLKILGLYSSLNYNLFAWNRGNIILYPAAGVASSKLISLFLDFGGPINIKEDDELYIEVSVGANAFTAAMDLGVSFVEFNPNFAIGYEKYTPQIKSKVVQANETEQKFSIGDNCLKLAFLNFDKNDISDNVIVSATVQSKQYTASLSFFDILNRHWNRLVSPVINHRFGNTQPLVVGNQAFPFLPDYPQSAILNVGTKDNPIDMDNCQVALTLNSAATNASQNYIVSTVGSATRRLIERATARENKHFVEKVSSLPPK